MIAIERDREAVDPYFAGATYQSWRLKLFTAARDQTLDERTTKKKLFASERWKKAKAQLAIESHGKCNFCETDVLSNYYGDVEHFRPKNPYWWLAHFYDNYLFSCRFCNGKKSNRFETYGAELEPPVINPDMNDDDLADLANRVSPTPQALDLIDPILQEHANEGYALLNPYTLSQQDIDRLIAWNPVDQTQRVYMISRNTAESERAVNSMIKYVDINRQDLAEARYRVYESFKFYHEIYNTHQDPTALAGLLAGCEAKYPFAGMIRYFVYEVWGIDPQIV